MKRLLSTLALTFLLTLAGRAQFAFIAAHRGAFTETKGTATPTNGTIYIEVSHPGYLRFYVSGINPSIGGTWTEKLGVRTFSAYTSSNAWTGTIKNGVVRGRFTNYINGISGTFECLPSVAP